MIMSSVRSGAATASLSAAILAGGRASRFGGADKASLVVDGARILDRQLAALSAVVADIVLVCSDAQRYAGLPIPVIPDVVAGAGPIGGIYTALVAAHHPWVIVLACDMPFVSGPLFECLAGEVDASIEAVLPRSGRGLEPLCGVYARAAAPVLRQRIESGDWRLTALAAALRVKELGPEALASLDHDGRLFENVNTPHDYARAREMKQER